MTGSMPNSSFCLAHTECKETVMSLNYTLTCRNNSTISGTFSIFLTLKNHDPSVALSPKSPVWMAKKVHAKTETVFSWEENLFFIWGEYLSEDTIHTSSKIKTDMGNPNRRAALFRYQDGAYLLQVEKQPVSPEKLLIISDETVKPGEAVVGLGCQADKSGVGRIVYDAFPNVTYSISPTFDFYVTFGNYQKGTVLSLDTLRTPYAKIPFSREKDSFIAVMRQDNQLVVRQNRNEKD